MVLLLYMLKMDDVFSYSLEVVITTLVTVLHSQQNIIVIFKLLQCAGAFP